MESEQVKKAFKNGKTSGINANLHYNAFFASKCVIAMKSLILDIWFLNNDDDDDEDAIQMAFSINFQTIF